MPLKKVDITIKANSEIELLNLERVVKSIENLSPDQLKRLGELLKSPKALDYLSSDIKFRTLKAFL